MRSVTLRGIFDKLWSTVIYGVAGRSERPKNRWECASLKPCISVRSMGLKYIFEVNMKECQCPKCSPLLKCTVFFKHILFVLFVWGFF